MILLFILLAIENHIFRQLPKNIALQIGTSISAWDGRNSIELFGTTGAVAMVPVGDGSYEYRLDLVPGQEYNYIFFAYTTSTIDGLKLNTTYYDTVSTYGSDGIIISYSSVNILDIANSTKGYISITGDARRYIVVPDVAEGTTLYVFNNFAGRPYPPNKIAARPGNGAVLLRWSEPLTPWGGIQTGESFRPVDVITGGFIIFRSTNGVHYENIAYVAGSSSITYLNNIGMVYEYIDTGLTNGTTYYYVVVSSDAYYSLNLTSNYSNTVAAKPGREITTIFKVEGYDFKDYEYVWLTPSGSNILLPSNKLLGRFLRVYLPHEKI